MTKHVIMLSGFKNAGKDTTANILGKYLLKEHNSIEYYALAQPIKHIASILFEIPYEVLDGKTKENRHLREQPDKFWEQYIPNFTPRKSLTLLGTDVLREYIHDDIWILKAQKYILTSTADVVIITDLREPNEESKMAEFCKNNGIYVHHFNIRRQTPIWLNLAIKAYFNKDEDAYNALEEMGVHPSEWKQVGLTPDVIIMNNRDDYTLFIQKQLEVYFDAYH